MTSAITAADANRKFSLILREVRSGASYVVTAHGKPVARIVPFDGEDSSRVAARTALLQRLRAQSVTDIGPWQRDDLYER